MPSTLIVGEVIHTNDLSSYNFASSGVAKNSMFGFRAVYWGGSPPPNTAVDTLDYFAIGTISNAADFGEITQARSLSVATSGD